MPGFASGLRFHPSQILCRLNKSPSDEIKLRSPVCVGSDHAGYFSDWYHIINHRQIYNNSLGKLVSQRGHLGLTLTLTWVIVDMPPPTVGHLLTCWATIKPWNGWTKRTVRKHPSWWNLHVKKASPWGSHIAIKRSLWCSVSRRNWFKMNKRD